MCELAFQWGPPILGHTDIPQTMGIVITHRGSKQNQNQVYKII